MGKYCVYQSCKNREQSKKYTANCIRYFPVPKPSTNYVNCVRWLDAINRDELKTVDVKQHHHVCSRHFVGGNGPTSDHPDPIQDDSPKSDHDSSSRANRSQVKDSKETVSF